MRASNVFDHVDMPHRGPHPFRVVDLTEGASMTLAELVLVWGPMTIAILIVAIPAWLAARFTRGTRIRKALVAGLVVVLFGPVVYVLLGRGFGRYGRAIEIATHCGLYEGLPLAIELERERPGVLALGDEPLWDWLRHDPRFAGCSADGVGADAP